MKFLFLSIFLVGCAATKNVHVVSNEPANVIVDGHPRCVTPCVVKFSVTDSSTKTIGVQNKKNHFLKYSVFHIGMFQKDTTIEFNF